MLTEITERHVVDRPLPTSGLVETRRCGFKEIPQALFERVTGIKLEEGQGLLADGSIIYGSSAREIAAHLSNGLVDPRDPRVGIRDGSEISAPEKVSESDVDVITTQIPTDEWVNSRTYPGRKVLKTTSSSGVSIVLNHYDESDTPQERLQKTTPLIFDCVWVESTPEGKLFLADPLHAYSDQEQIEKGDGVNPSFIDNLPNMPYSHVIAMLMRLGFVSPYYLEDTNIESIADYFKDFSGMLSRAAVDSIEETIKQMLFTRYADAGWVEEHFSDFGLLGFLRETFPKYFGLGYRVIVDDEGSRVRFRSYVDENGHYYAIRLNTQYISGEFASAHPEIVRDGRIVVESCLTGPPSSRGGYPFETTWIEVLVGKDGKCLGQSPIHENRWFPNRCGSDPPPRVRNLWYKNEAS